jgi:glycerol-3-phosphate acyltransferase PlsY
MDTWTALFAAAVGYLAGSFSSARAVTRIFAPGHVLEGIKIKVPGGRAVFRSSVISGTTVRLHLGARYGCLTSSLDILKAALPAIAFRVWRPDAPYYLIAAALATIGHNWPVYHRFKGGRGMSPILGGMLVVDWPGVVVTQLIGAATGLVIKNLLIMIGTGTALMIPWVWFRTRSWPELVYVAAMNVVFWVAMIPEVKQHLRLKREGTAKEFSAAPHIRIVGRRGMEVIEMMSMSKLRAKIVGLFRHADGMITRGDELGSEVDDEYQGLTG